MVDQTSQSENNTNKNAKKKDPLPLLTIEVLFPIILLFTLTVSGVGALCTLGWHTNIYVLVFFITMQIFFVVLYVLWLDVYSRMKQSQLSLTNVIHIEEIYECAEIPDTATLDTLGEGVFLNEWEEVTVQNDNNKQKVYREKAYSGDFPSVHIENIPSEALLRTVTPHSEIPAVKIQGYYSGKSDNSN